MIPNESEIRARVTKNQNPVSYEDIEDALDELINQQMKEIKPEAKNDFKTGGYSDIDI